MSLKPATSAPKPYAAVEAENAMLKQQLNGERMWREAIWNFSACFSQPPVSESPKTTSRQGSRN